jgi:hypothetical protein
MSMMDAVYSQAAGNEWGVGMCVHCRELTDPGTAADAGDQQQQQHVGGGTAQKLCKQLRHAAAGSSRAA